MEGWNLFVCTRRLFCIFLHSPLKYVSSAWMCVCVYIYWRCYMFGSGIIKHCFWLYTSCCIYKLWSINWSEMYGPTRNPFGKREGTTCRAFLALCVNNYCKKGNQLTNFQSWLSDWTAPLVMKTSEIIGSPFIFDSQKRTKIGKTCQNQYIEAQAT